MHDDSAANDAQSMLEFIAEHTNDVIVRTGRDGIVHYVSPSLRHFGHRPEDIVGTNGMQLFHPEDLPRFAANTAALLRGDVGADVDRQHRFRNADGTWGWIEGHPRLVRDAAGEVVEVVTIFRDINRQRATEAALRESEARYRLIADNMNDLVIQADVNGILTYASPSVRAYGYRPEDLIGRHADTLLHPDDLAQVLVNRARVAQGLSSPSDRERQNRYRTADGGWVWLEGFPQILRDAEGRPIGVMNVLRDISERRAQADLFEAAFNSAPVVMALADLNYRYLRVNPEACRVLGYSEAEFLELTGADIAHPDEAGGNNEDIARLLAGEIAHFECERRYRRADGDYVWLRIAVALVRNADGSPKHYINYAQDQTARRAALAAQQDIEARYRLIAENMTDIVVQADFQGVLTYVSPSVRAYGYEPEALMGRPSSELLHPDDRARSMANVTRAATGLSPGSIDDRVNRFQAADGSWIWLEGNPRLLPGADGQSGSILNVMRDVTERREQSQLFETAFANAPVALSLTGLDGSMLRVNAAACRALGHPENTLLSLTVADLSHPDEYGSQRDNNLRLLRGEIESYDSERRFRRGDGSYVWMALAVSLVRNADGSPKHFITLSHDLTARRAAETALQESEARYRTIAEQTSDIIAMSDADGIVRYMSPAIRQLGFEPGELVGKTFAPHTHPEDAGRMWRVLQAQVKGGPVERIRWRARHKTTAEWVWMESAPTRLWHPETGVANGFLDVVRDISVQVRQEEALAQARADAEAAASVKSQFLANMSHEIRTPLTAVLGYTELLGATAGLNDGAQAYVRRIAGGGTALLAIVNDILDFSKLEAGMVEVRPQPADLAGLVEETMALFEGRVAEKGLTLAWTLDERLPAAVMLDSDRLRQILVNLAGNAVKFTDQGGVTLRVTSAEDGQVLRFEIEDTGPGLDAEQCARLFQRFNQIDGSTTRRHGGTGLGLAICKGLAEAMGGAVGVTSTPGQGSIFHLTVPLEAVELGDAPAVAADIASIAGLRVLVVDDNATNRELARRILEAFGAEITEAEGGAEALAALATQVADVVLMDLRMPDMDGREALARLRAQDGPNRDVPVLAFTADAEVGDGANLEAFDGVARKPIDPMALAGGIALAAAGVSAATRSGDRAAVGR